MGSGVDLLRMLEPPVRPGGVAGPTRQASTPIESKSFESVLQEAQSMPSDGDQEQDLAGPPKQAPSASPLAALAQVDRIENPAMRFMAAGETSAQE